MRFVHILQNYVGSFTRFESNPTDIDIRFFYLHNVTKNSFHIKKKSIDSDKILDIDYWEIETVLNEILNGGDCAPFLFNTITSPKYSDPLEIGNELIENRQRLIGKELIDGSLKYIDRKLLLANGEFPLPNNKTATPHKQIYYACSDLIELYLNLTNEIHYPIKLEKNILDIKNGIISHNDSIEILYDIRSKVVGLNINNKPDLKWGNEFIQNCYKYYNGL